jgi:SAM-dependent methyltransferase
LAGVNAWSMHQHQPALDFRRSNKKSPPQGVTFAKHSKTFEKIHAAAFVFENSPIVNFINQMNSTGFKCLCCEAEKAEPLMLQCEDYYMRKPGRFDYYRCIECGLIQLHPIPSDMTPYYETYQVHQRKSRLHELFRSWLMRGVYYAPVTQAAKMRILDFGCGDGWFLSEMKKKGHHAVGFEPNPIHASQLARNFGLQVFSDFSSLESLESFDAVTMHFVVEHVSNLHETFKLANRMLKPGGHFYFVIPNIRSTEARIFKRKWHGFDPPRHLSFPTLPVIEHLAMESNFSVEHTKISGTPNDLAGTLSNVLFGRYYYPAFCALIPLAVVWCMIGAQGNLAVKLIKQR